MAPPSEMKTARMFSCLTTRSVSFTEPADTSSASSSTHSAVEPSRATGGLSTRG